MINNWIKAYRENGIEGLTSKKKPGNSLTKYSNKKNLTEMEQLQYENMKLRIENERLKRLPSERRWYSCSSRQEKVLEFEIVEILSKEFSVKSLCEVMNISRSGYYKWLKTKDILNRYEKNRKDLEPLIRDIHKRKPSYGYHRINAVIFKETGWIVSDNLVHKICKILKIRSKARHYGIYKKPGEESIKYPNLINNNWKTSRPFEKITSDTTMIWFKKQRYDWTYYIDAFDDSIIGSDVKPFYHGVSMSNHKNALYDMLNSKIKRGYKRQETIFHSNQGQYIPRWHLIMHIKIIT